MRKVLMSSIAGVIGVALASAALESQGRGAGLAEGSTSWCAR